MKTTVITQPRAFSLSLSLSVSLSPSPLHLRVACIAFRARGVQSRSATYINNSARCKSEDTLLLPSESEALSDAMVARRPEGVSGSVAMAIRWDRCHGGAAWNIHPPASFPRFPLLPPALPRPPPSPSPPHPFALSRSLLMFLLPPPSPPPLLLAVRVFLPRYTYVFTRPPSALSSSLPRHSRRPFCSQADSLPEGGPLPPSLSLSLSLCVFSSSFLALSSASNRASTPAVLFRRNEFNPGRRAALCVASVGLPFSLSLSLLRYCFAITIDSA